MTAFECIFSECSSMANAVLYLELSLYLSEMIFIYLLCKSYHDTRKIMQKHKKREKKHYGINNTNYLLQLFGLVFLGVWIHY